VVTSCVFSSPFSPTPSLCQRSSPSHSSFSEQTTPPPSSRDLCFSSPPLSRKSAYSSLYSTWTRVLSALTNLSLSFYTLLPSQFTYRWYVLREGFDAPSFFFLANSSIHFNSKSFDGYRRHSPEEDTSSPPSSFSSRPPSSLESFSPECFLRLSLPSVEIRRSDCAPFFLA